MSRILWPVLFFGGLGATYVAFESGLNPVVVIAGGYLGFMGLVALLEHVLPHNPEWNHSDGQIVNDLTLNFFGVWLTNKLSQAGIVALLVGPQVWLANRFGGELWPGGWPMAAQVALGLVLVDLGGYTAHRLAHEIPLLWRFHALHHSSTRLCFINTGRFHPGDTLLSVVVSSPILILSGAPAEVLLWIAAVANYVGILTHSNLDVRPGIFSYVFNTPELHRWHHSYSPDEANRNYGNTTILYDLLLGTYFNPARPAPRKLGIFARMPQTIAGQLLSPFRFSRHEAEGRER